MRAHKDMSYAVSPAATPVMDVYMPQMGGADIPCDLHQFQACAVSDALPHLVPRAPGGSLLSCSTRQRSNDVPVSLVDLGSPRTLPPTVNVHPGTWQTVGAQSLHNLEHDTGGNLGASKDRG